MLLILPITAYAEDTDREKIERACLNYLEGFYEGDKSKLIESLKPTVYKYGYFKSEKTGQFEGTQMTFDKALAYAENVKTTKKFADPDAPKEIVIFEVGEKIASAKVTAWWGIDYMLLSRSGDKWMIEQVLWEQG